MKSVDSNQRHFRAKSPTSAVTLVLCCSSTSPTEPGNFWELKPGEPRQRVRPVRDQKHLTDKGKLYRRHLLAELCSWHFTYITTRRKEWLKVKINFLSFKTSLSYIGFHVLWGAGECYHCLNIVTRAQKNVMLKAGFRVFTYICVVTWT